MDRVPVESPEGPGGRVVHARMVELIDRLSIYDSRIRRHEPGGVHKMRVTLRRLRSLLATFGSLFDAGACESLREDLTWVAGELGGARDLEVVRKRLSALVASPEERALADRIEARLDAAQSAGVQRAIGALESDRYAQVLRDLSSFATDPPWTPDAHGSVGDRLRPWVWRDWKRLRRRARTASAAPGDAERPAALHQVRKAPSGFGTRQRHSFRRTATTRGAWFVAPSVCRPTSARYRTALSPRECCATWRRSTAPRPLTSQSCAGCTQRNVFARQVPRLAMPRAGPRSRGGRTVDG